MIDIRQIISCPCRSASWLAQTEWRGSGRGFRFTHTPRKQERFEAVPESASPFPRIWLVSLAAGQFTWNADNRLISIENSTHREEYDYDYMGRRWRLKTYTKSGGAWVLSMEKRFVYDGYRQIAEFRNWAKFNWANCVLSGPFSPQLLVA